MIERPQHLQRLETLVERSPVTAILGARQVGKTTLARQLLERRSGPSTYLDLEDPQHLARLADPMLALAITCLP